MYLANLYVSLLELITDGIEASLDVFGSLVKSDSFAKAIALVLSQKIFIGPDALGITPRSDMNSFIETPRHVRDLVRDSKQYSVTKTYMDDITPRSDMNSFIQTPSFAASKAAMCSASHVGPSTTLCLELHQLTAPPFNINTYPVCDLESSGSVSKLALM